MVLNFFIFTTVVESNGHLDIEPEDFFNGRENKPGKGFRPVDVPQTTITLLVSLLPASRAVGAAEGYCFVD
jgi:hypothetical protein